MTPERWSRIKFLFRSATEEPEHCNRQWLASECSGDTRLLEEVTHLIGNHQALSLESGTERSPRGAGLLSSERFRIEHLVGSGGYGDVYVAFDRKREERIAMKRLRAPGSDALLSFKQEFRLCRINHPNLVRFYELQHEGSEWFIVMELLDGCNLVSALEGLSRGEMFRRMPRILEQICLGLGTLHSRNILHRDIKPSNIWMTNEGRVVLLDFGLAKLVDAKEHAGGLIGTADYVSPEQVRGGPLTVASDWYGVGVILYHLLTGRRPFEGDMRAVLRAKTESDPRHPCLVAPDVPPFFGDLCMGLLDRNIATRFGSSKLLSAGWVTESGQSAAVQPLTRLIGRDRELEQLHGAWEAVRTFRKPVCVCITGDSGIGKTELVQSFLESIDSQSGRGVPIILRGSCYEAESVPYKAFDGVVDDLARQMTGFHPAFLDAILPSELHALTQVFPVFQRHDAIRRSDCAEISNDPAGQRRAGFQAFREILTRLAARRNVVLFVDDLHWGDSENTELMTYLLSGNDAPGVLTIFTWPKEENHAPLPALLSETPSRFDLEIRALSLESLDDRNAEILANGLLPQATAQTVRWVLTESHNSPFLIHEHAAIARRRAIVSESFTGAALIESRTKTLDPPAHEMLRVIAVAGGPLPEVVIREAANLQQGFHDRRDTLIDSRLIRATMSASHPGLDMYHARQRVGIAAAVSESEAVHIHLRIANALENTGHTDLERIYDHLRKARQPIPAAIYAERAGDQAFSQLAFERAARLFEEALQIQPDTPPSASLQRKLGNARANAGLGEKAAEAYMHSAAADPRASLDLQILATEQLLRSGSVNAGLKALAQVSKRAHVPWARTRIGLFASVVALRAKLRMKGLKPRLVRPPHGLLDQIRICWIGAIGTSMSDPLRSAEYSARHLLLCLESNDPRRLCLAYAVEAAHSLPETLRVATPEQFMNAARTLSRQLHDDSADAFLAFIEGLIACNNGQWNQCIEQCTLALDLYRKSTSGIGWDRTTVSSFILSSRILRGDWTVAANDIPVLVREAEQRGDRYAAVNLPLLTSSYLHLLASDDPASARDEAHRLLDIWEQPRFDLQRFYTFLADVDSFLYEGEVARALNELRAAWPHIRRAGMLRLPLMRIRTYYLGGACCIAAAAKFPLPSRRRQRLLNEARAFCRKLDSEPKRYAVATSAGLQAAIAMTEGDAPSAETLLVKAERLLNEADLLPWAAACRSHRTGEYQRDAWFAREKVVDPHRLASTILPGDWG